MTQAKSSQSSVPLASSPVSGWRQLWRWWSGELKAMLPTAILRWLDGDAVAANVAVDAGGVTVINVGNEATKLSLPRRVPIDAFANNPLLRDLISAGRDRVRLVLTPDQALVKTITLPLATEENLRAVVGFELDRHTPFTPDQAYYDVQTVRRDPQHEKITVALAVASKFDIAALLATLRRAGLTCTAIGISEGAVAAGDSAMSFDLQPAVEKPPRRLSRMHQINLGSLALAAVFAFAAVIVPIWQKREAVKALIPQAAKSGAEFQISERVYTEYTKLAAEYNFLATKKHAVYPVLSVLEELAKTFPDTTWVQRLDIKLNGKVREVTILGEAQSASKVIENLEQSPSSLFQNSKQLTQTIRIQPNTERFHVSAEIKPRPVPTAESIDGAVVPAAIAPIPSSMPIPSAPAAVNIPAVSSVAPVLTPLQPAPATVPEQGGGKSAAATPPASILPPAPPTTLNPPFTTLSAPPAMPSPPAKMPAPPATPSGKGGGT